MNVMNHPQRKSVRITILTACFGIMLFAASTRAGGLDDFQNANQLYREEHYQDAARSYESFLKERPSAELYYNLANAYFKDRKLGLAVLNYERALRLAPRDRDSRANLTYANRLIEYEVKDKRPWYLKVLQDGLAKVTLKECLVAALSFYLVFLVVSCLSLVVGTRWRLASVWLSLLTLSVFLAAVSFLKFTNSGAGAQAVVTSHKAEVRYGPSKSDRLAFRLSEGLKVTMRDKKQDWFRISLLDGQSGWVAESEVTII